MSIIEWKSSKTKGVKQEATVDYQGGELLWCIRKSPSGQNYQVFLGDSRVMNYDSGNSIYCERNWQRLVQSYSGTGGSSNNYAQATTRNRSLFF